MSRFIDYDQANHIKEVFGLIELEATLTRHFDKLDDIQRDRIYWLISMTTRELQRCLTKQKEAQKAAENPFDSLPPAPTKPVEAPSVKLPAGFRTALAFADKPPSIDDL